MDARRSYRDRLRLIRRQIDDNWHGHDAVFISATSRTLAPRSRRTWFAMAFGNDSGAKFGTPDVENSPSRRAKRKGRKSPVKQTLREIVSRRTALSVAAASGLALAGQNAARDDLATAKERRGKRGRRGYRGHRGKRGSEGENGQNGPTGPTGPAAGAGAQVVPQTCTINPDAPDQVGDSEGCQALCPAGFVAVGGGYQGPTVIEALGQVVASFPTQNGSGQPNGWQTTIEYLNIGQTFDVTTYAICLPD
jgi:hypothetical protein